MATAAIGVPLLLAAMVTLMAGVFPAVGIPLPDPVTELEALSWAAVGAAVISAPACWAWPSLTGIVAGAWAIVTFVAAVAPVWLTPAAGDEGIIVTAIVRMAQCASGITCVVCLEAVILHNSRRRVNEQQPPEGGGD